MLYEQDLEVLKEVKSETEGWTYATFPSAFNIMIGGMCGFGKVYIPRDTKVILHNGEPQFAYRYMTKDSIRSAKLLIDRPEIQSINDLIEELYYARYGEHMEETDFDFETLNKELDDLETSGILSLDKEYQERLNESIFESIAKLN